MNVLVINAGSSSLKYQLFDMDTEAVIAKGICERIGLDGRLKHTPLNGKSEFKADISLPTHAEAINAVIEKLTSKDYGVIGSLEEIGAVGHRVVHGGEKFSESALIDDNVIATITECIPLGPLHNPANLMGIKACQKIMPGVPQVAVFDTAFHQTMPEYAYIYPIPYICIMKNTESADTVSTARPTGMYPGRRSRSSAFLKRGHGSSPATSETARPSRLSRTASASTRRWASHRWKGSRWAHGAEASTRPSLSRWPITKTSRCIRLWTF
jgi:hypothetical protein